MAYVSKSSSFLFVSALLLSIITLPCIESCPTCSPTKKAPPPPTPCPPPPHKKSPTPPTVSPTPPTVSPTPPTVSPPKAQSCPIDILKLGACADLLGLVDLLVGTPTSGSKCCTLLNGLADLDAAVCLCTAIKANVLGLKLDIPVSLSVLLNACNKKIPSGYTCK